jgi:hypothetical protein
LEEIARTEGESRRVAEGMEDQRELTKLGEEEGLYLV